MAAAGVVDFASCDIHDESWRRYLRLCAHGFRLQDRVTMRRIDYDYELAYASNPRIDVNAQHAILRESHEDLRATLYPHLGVTSEERQSRRETDFKQRWEEITGFSPDDVDSLVEWESKLRDHLQNSTMSQEREQEEMADKLRQFNEQVEQIKQRRLKRTKRQ